MKKQALYKEVNLWRCEPGDKVLRRDKAIPSYYGTRCAALPHCVGGMLYDSSGLWYGYTGSRIKHGYDITAILTGKGRTQ